MGIRMALAWAWLGPGPGPSWDPNGNAPVVIQPGASLGFRPCSTQPPVASPGVAEWRPTLFAETYAGNMAPRFSSSACGSGRPAWVRRLRGSG